jgi:hypothetical protein
MRRREVRAVTWMVLAWFTVVGQQRVLAQSGCCAVPTSESTSYVGGAGAVGIEYITVGQFNQTISDGAGTVFNGQTVEEQGAIGAGSSGCNWDGSGLPTDPQPSGGSWVVAGGDVSGQSNHWGMTTSATHIPGRYTFGAKDRHTGCRSRALTLFHKAW